MARVLTVLTVLIGILAGVGCGGNSSDASDSGTLVEGDEIVLGAHTPLTGPASFVGQGFRLGAELAVDEISDQGGIGSRTLKLNLIDDEGTPAGASAAVRRLVQQDRAFAVIGGGTSTATIPQIPFFAQRPETIYYVSLASDDKVVADFHENVFMGATLPQETIAGGMAEYIAQETDIGSVAIMQCDQGHCQAGVPQLQTALEDAGIKVTGVQEFASGDTDFTGQIGAITDANPDAVVIYGLAADGGRIIPQLRRAGLDGEIIGDTSLADPSVAEVAGPSAEGFAAFWLASPQYINDRSGAMGEWLDKFEAAYPDAPAGTPSLYSLMGYADVYVLAEAMRRCGEELTTECTIRELEGMEGFVAGEGETWPQATPVGTPRSFSPDDHQGSEELLPVIVEDEKLQSAD